MSTNSNNNSIFILVGTVVGFLAMKKFMEQNKQPKIDIDEKMYDDEPVEMLDLRPNKPDFTQTNGLECCKNDQFAYRGGMDLLDARQVCDLTREDISDRVIHSKAQPDEETNTPFAYTCRTNDHNVNMCNIMGTCGQSITKICDVNQKMYKKHSQHY